MSSAQAPVPQACDATRTPSQGLPEPPGNCSAATTPEPREWTRTSGTGSRATPIAVAPVACSDRASTPDATMATGRGGDIATTFRAKVASRPTVTMPTARSASACAGARAGRRAGARGEPRRAARRSAGGPHGRTGAGARCLAVCGVRCGVRPQARAHVRKRLRPYVEVAGGGPAGALLGACAPAVNSQ